MKKIFLSFFVVLCLFLIGCEQPAPELPTYEEYEQELSEYLDELIPNEVFEDIDLPKIYLFEDESMSELEWESSNGRTITKKGTFRQNLFDEEITLTATVLFCSYDGYEYEYEYKKTVQTKGTEDLDAYREIIESYIPDYVYKDFEIVERDIEYIDKNMPATITYTSTRPDVITSDGKYVNVLPDDQEVEFQYSVKINGFTFEGSKIITVEGEKSDYYVTEAEKWLEEYFANQGPVFDTLDLPVTDDFGRVDITWKSDDVLVFSHDGAIQSFDANKKANMIATITYNEKVNTWTKEFRGYNDDEILDFIVHRMHREELQQFSMRTYDYTVENLGYIPFYTVDTALEDLVLTTTNYGKTLNYLTGSYNTNTARNKIVTGIVPWDAMGRPQTLKTSTEYITIHDTGDASHDAAWWNALESTGSDNRQTSWHFTAGDDTIYQQIPLDEVAWHAGDGSARAGFNDTGVPYDGPNPEITLGKVEIDEKGNKTEKVDGYLYINGQRSKIVIPRISGSFDDWNGQYANFISPAGLYTYRGKNGNYYMGNIYASNYSQNLRKYYVCTAGGNRNSVGIETCINRGVDYNQVIRHTSNLVAKLLVYYNLDPSRVLYHQHFSGKLCPQVMIENNMLANMHNIIENEYFIAKYLPGVSFTYESKNVSIMDNEGKILQAVTQETNVQYSVTVTFNGKTKTFDLSTTVKPIK